jgi:hypothetical protein
VKDAPPLLCAGLFHCIEARPAILRPRLALASRSSPPVLRNFDAAGRGRMSGRLFSLFRLPRNAHRHAECSCLDVRRRHAALQFLCDHSCRCLSSPKCLECTDIFLRPLLPTNRLLRHPFLLIAAGSAAISQTRKHHFRGAVFPHHSTTGDQKNARRCGQRPRATSDRQRLPPFQRPELSATPLTSPSATAVEFPAPTA